MDREQIDLEQVRAVLRIASEADDIAELTVETPTLKVSVRKAGGRTEVEARAGQPAHNTAARSAAAMGAAPAAPAAAVGAGLQPPAGTPSPAAQAVAFPGAEAPLPDHMQAITAPMVGTFYSAPSPDAPPFVQEGDPVDTGQTVCIIEAMKLFNEIQSEVAGRVARVLVENGTPVEYGQPLFLIEPPA